MMKRIVSLIPHVTLVIVAGLLIFLGVQTPPEESERRAGAGGPHIDDRVNIDPSSVDLAVGCTARAPGFTGPGILREAR